MTGSITSLARTALIAAGIVLSLVAPAVADSGKVVVELFTSQGCSSCPPADRLVGELARRDDVIALSFHVDYWNYLGWKDPFSSPESTARQRAYRRALGLRYVYTPQIVIAGTDQAVGSSRETVLKAIERRRGQARLPVSITHPAPTEAVVSIGAGPRPPEPLAVWLFAYDRKHTTEIRRGENAGVTLTNANVVRVQRRIGSWSGAAETIRLSLKDLNIAGQDGCAVIVQPAGGGPILGAADFRMTGKSG